MSQSGILKPHKDIGHLFNNARFPRNRNVIATIPYLYVLSKNTQTFPFYEVESNLNWRKVAYYCFKDWTLVQYHLLTATSGNGSQASHNVIRFTCIYILSFL